MSVKTQVICEICNVQILPTEVSFSVMGNVYVVDTDEPDGHGGGLFGGAWPLYEGTEFPKPPDLHFHLECFKRYVETLGDPFHAS